MIIDFGSRVLPHKVTTIHKSGCKHLLSLDWPLGSTVSDLLSMSIQLQKSAFLSCFYWKQRALSRAAKSNWSIILNGKLQLQHLNFSHLSYYVRPSLWSRESPTHSTAAASISQDFSNYEMQKDSKMLLYLAAARWHNSTLQWELRLYTTKLFLWER